VDNTDEPDEEQIRIRRLNKKAAGILFQSMVNSTPEGKKAVDAIKPHYTGEDNINPGHFPNAWNASKCMECINTLV